MNEAQRRSLLAVDASINAVLGLCLLALPGPTIGFLGLPGVASDFYVSVLGAVLLGIGVALWMERKDDARWRGLGLPGALVINVLGAGTVLVWLLSGSLHLPFRGYLSLWVVVVVVLGTGLAELLALVSRSDSAG